MNKDFLYYYNLELEHLRQMCGEFAHKNPKIAARLGLSAFECSDLYVERLIQGFSFLAAGVHQDLDSEYSKISKALIYNLFPDFMLPVPSLGIIKIKPNHADMSPKGNILDKGSLIHSNSEEDTENCRFSTGQDIKLWPVDITGAEYYTDEMAYLNLGQSAALKSCLKFNLKFYGESSFKELEMDDLEFYISHGNTKIASEIYELLLANCKQIIIRSSSKKHWPEHVIIYNTLKDKLIPLGFGENEALYNFNNRVFEGHRLLQRYLFFHTGYMSVRLKGIKKALRQIQTKEAEILFLFDTEILLLKNNISKNNFSMYCSPVVNLYEKTIQSIAKVNKTVSKIHIADPGTFVEKTEIVKILDVESSFSGGRIKKYFPFYSNAGIIKRAAVHDGNTGFYIEERMLPVREKTEDVDGNIINEGTELYLNIVDENGNAVQDSFDKLSVKALCSNRISRGITSMEKKSEDTGLTIDAGISFKDIQFLYGPTEPHSEHLFTSYWDVINHISNNWLSVKDDDGIKAVQVFKSIFDIYSVDSSLKKTIDSLKSVKISKGTLRIKENGNFSFANGKYIDVCFNNDQGADTQFLLGMVIDSFFMYAEPMNTFIQTTINIEGKEQGVQLPVRKGLFPLI